MFYDRHGGSVVGLLWNPEKLQSRNLKAFQGYSTKPAGGEVSLLFLMRSNRRTDEKAALVALNKEAVLGEIARLGHGIIERIEQRSK